MTKRKIYDNILKTPFQPFRLYTTSPENFNKYKTELKSKEEALFAHYGLSRPKKLNEETRALIRKMAQDLKIRGFFHNDEINEVGRPRKWKTSYEKSILFIIVEHYKKQHPAELDTIDDSGSNDTNVASASSNAQSDKHMSAVV